MARFKIKSIMVVGALGLVFVGINRYSSLLGLLTSYAVYPVLKSYQIIIDPIKQVATRYHKSFVLGQECKKLQDEVGELRAQNIYLRATLAYMQNIKELRLFKDRYYQSGVVAHVLARHFSEHSHFFYLDAGVRDGIEKGMIVTYKNNLVGKVIEVYPWYSKVCLVTDRLCKVAAHCVTTGAHGIYEGINKPETASLCFVNHLANVKEGEVILSRGEGLVFPEGLALGRIASWYPDGLYKKITVTPLCDLQSIDYCTIIAKQ